MDITRAASQRFRGVRYVIQGFPLKLPTKYSFDHNVRWDQERKEIVIRQKWVPAGDGRTSHNYEITLTLEDVTALVEILGQAGSSGDAAALRKHLGKQVPELVKLLACATGLVPTPIPTPAT